MLLATSLLQADTDDITSTTSYGHLIHILEGAHLGHLLCLNELLQNSFSKQVAAEGSVGRAPLWVVSGYCKGQWLTGDLAGAVTKSGPRSSWEDKPQSMVQFSEVHGWAQAWL